MQDQTPTHPQGLISIKYPDIHEWCSHLGCTEVQLAEALAIVGNCPERVAEYLACHGVTRGLPRGGPSESMPK